MNRIDLAGRVAVVTGAAQGIGRAVAGRFAASGAAVALWDFNGERLQEAASAMAGQRVSTHRLDVSDEAAVAAAAAETRAALGEPGILVCCAGILGGTHDLADYPLAEWNRLMQVHLAGTFLPARAFVPAMAERGWGRFVTISSDSGKEGTPRMPAYATAKAGILGLTRSIAREFATRGVTANSISPTIIDTEMGREAAKDFGERAIAKIPMKRFGTAEEIAAMVAWLCSPDASFTSGAVFDATGGRSHY